MVRAFYVRLASWALLSVPIGLLVLLGALAAIGGSSPRGVTTILVFLSIVCVLLGLPLRYTAWWLIPTVVIAPLLALIAFGTQSQTGFHPESFFDFATALLTIAGPLTAFVACIVALVKRHRGTLAPNGTHHGFVWIEIAAFGALMAFSIVFTLVQPSAAGVPRGAILVRMHHTRFIPANFSIPEGKHVPIFVRNEDAFAHSFTVDGLGIDEYIGPGAGRLITVRNAAPKVYDLTCYVTGHDGMTGRIRVT